MDFFFGCTKFDHQIVILTCLGRSLKRSPKRTQGDLFGFFSMCWRRLGSLCLLLVVGVFFLFFLFFCFKSCFLSDEMRTGHFSVNSLCWKHHNFICDNLACHHVHHQNSWAVVWTPSFFKLAGGFKHFLDFFPYLGKWSHLTFIFFKCLAKNHQLLVVHLYVFFFRYFENLRPTIHHPFQELCFTPRKTNMEPENEPLEEEIPIINPHFQVPC